MLKKRIIPCLDIKDNRVVKGCKFENLKDAGSPVEIAKYYSDNGADELVFLDITAGIKNQLTAVDLASKIAREINIPFTIGGGLKNINDITRVLYAGADKVAINTAAVENPKLISEGANIFGSQCIVCALDYILIDNTAYIVTKSGGQETRIKLFDFIKIAEDAGCGEFLLTAKYADGTQNGFDIDTLKNVAQITSRPIIASGGAGRVEDFRKLFVETNVSAGLAASIFHYKKVEIKELKEYLINNNIEISKWK
jgi:cyclase